MAYRKSLILLILSLAVLLACGPDTIFLRPSLDTPQQHVKNGHSLLARGKIEAANAEFVRAAALDEGYAPAYVGLALIQGHQGDFASGLETLNRARSLAATLEESREVERGFEQLRGMQTAGQD
jgi:Tfp pilus assembly protein PilF